MACGSASAPTARPPTTTCTCGTSCAWRRSSPGPWPATPTSLSSATALRLATRGGGEALGLPVGALEVGRPADVIRLRTDDARFTPAVSDAELLGHLVWAGAGYLVTDVWVGGHQVVEAGECTTVDGDRARAEVGQRARRLLGS